MKRKINIKGQVTIFIILSIVVVGIISLVFLFKSDINPFAPSTAETSPQKFMAKCVEDKMKEGIDLVLTQGGLIEPKNFHMFNDSKVAYLCYNAGNFYPCINQHPMFFTTISKELKEEIHPEIETCFLELEESMKKQGYSITLGNLIESEVSMTIGRVYLDIKRDITITRNEETSTFKEMRLTYSSSLYDLAIVANQIANSEAQFCYFEYLGYMVLNPNYKIYVKRMSDSTKIYSVIDERTKEQMNIAIRGCASL